MTARALALGDPHLIPAALIVTNLVAIGAAAYFGARLVSGGGHHAFFGLGIALLPGLLTSLVRDLAEPLALALLLGSLVALRRGQALPAALLMTLAVLTRETALIVLLAAGLLLIYRIFRRGPGVDSRSLWLFVTLPFGVFAAWQLFLADRWGAIPLFSARTVAGPPVQGLVDGFRFADMMAAGLPTLWLVEVGVLLGVAAAGLATLRRSSAPTLERLALILYVVLILVLTENVWRDIWAFVRVGTEPAALAVVVALDSDWPTALRASLLAAVMLGWGVLAFFTLPA